MISQLLSHLMIGTRENQCCKYQYNFFNIVLLIIIKGIIHLPFILFDYRPAFLPDPKDGSIYMIGASLKDPLKKLPFTIPELVAASPCKSSDGTLYTGKKVDTWFSIDRFTGRKKVIIMFRLVNFSNLFLTIN